MSLDTLPRPRVRDGLLDLLRSVSIIRVIFVHLIGKAEFWFWPAPTYVMPGMPVVFFVSGSLAFKSLRAVDGARRSALAYWRKTFRRLLLPYWAFYAVLTAYDVVGDLHHDEPHWTISYPRLLLGATGLVVPDASEAMRHHSGHVWFMSVFLVLAALAPALVRLFERAPMALLGAVLVPFVIVQWAVLSSGIEFDVELEKLTAFTIPYVIGFWYTEGTLRSVSQRVLALVAGLAAAAAYLWDSIEPGAVNASQTKHLLVSAAWLAPALAAAPLLRRVAARLRPLIDRITPRTFTTYLWGWATCVFAADTVDELVSPGWPNRILMVISALTLLWIVVVVFGRVEDYAAGTGSRVIQKRALPRRFAS